MRGKDEERRAEHSVTEDIAVAMFRIISELLGVECFETFQQTQQLPFSGIINAEESNRNVCWDAGNSQHPARYIHTINRRRKTLRPSLDVKCTLLQPSLWAYIVAEFVDFLRIIKEDT